MKEIKDNPNKLRDKLCFGIGRINIVKMTTLPKAIYRFSAILINYQWHFSQSLNKKNCTICIETQKIPTSQNNNEKEKWNCRNQTP